MSDGRPQPALTRRWILELAMREIAKAAHRVGPGLNPTTDYEVGDQIAAALAIFDAALAQPVSASLSEPLVASPNPKLD